MPTYLKLYLGYIDGVKYGSSAALFDRNESTFSNVYMAVFISQIIITVFLLILIGCNEHIGFNKLLNPITIYAGVLLIFTLIIRFGVILQQHYYPR